MIIIINIIIKYGIANNIIIVIIVIIVILVVIIVVVLYCFMLTVPVLRHSRVCIPIRRILVMETWVAYSKCKSTYAVVLRPFSYLIFSYFRFQVLYYLKTFVLNISVLKMFVLKTFVLKIPRSRSCPDSRLKLPES